MTKLIAGKLEANNALTDPSMAKAIEDAMAALVPYGVSEDPLGRRKLCIAIAQGVLRHLSDNAHAVHVTLNNGVDGAIELYATVDVDLGGQ